MQLGRGLVDGMSAEDWAKLDQRALDHFKAAVVCGREGLWSSRSVPAGTQSARIGGRDVELVELTSGEAFVHDTLRESSADLAQQLARAAQSLALAEDRLVVAALIAAEPSAKPPKKAKPPKEDVPDDEWLGLLIGAETKIRERVTNDELVVLVSPAVHAELDSRPFAHSTQLGHLERRFGSSFVRTRALPAQHAGAIVTTVSPPPVEIVRAGQPRVAVRRVDSSKLWFQVITHVAVGRSIIHDAVVVRG